MEQYTPEPWGLRDDYKGSVYLREQCVARCCEPQSEANARRIVACVNACAGIATDILEHAADFGAAGIQTIESVRNQRDELLAAIDVIIPALESRANGDSYLSSDQFNAVRKCREIKSDVKGSAA